MCVHRAPTSVYVCVFARVLGGGCGGGGRRLEHSPALCACAAGSPCAPKNVATAAAAASATSADAGPTAELLYTYVDTPRDTGKFSRVVLQVGREGGQGAWGAAQRCTAWAGWVALALRGRADRGPDGRLVGRRSHIQPVLPGGQPFLWFEVLCAAEDECTRRRAPQAPGRADTACCLVSRPLAGPGRQ